MIRGFYSAASGLVSRQDHLSAIANNMANSNTVAFKSQKADFSTLLYMNVNGGAANPVNVGHGTKLNRLSTDFSQGNLNKTNMDYDFAILGEGFFAINDESAGATTYSRSGNFRVSLVDNSRYLVDSKGGYVLDSAKEKINLEEGFDSSKIGVFSFKNLDGLRQIGGNQFIPTQLSGEAENIDEPTVKSGYLEASTVQVAREMVNMIEASKAFAFNSKVIIAADEMEKATNQLR